MITITITKTVIITITITFSITGTIWLILASCLDLEKQNKS